MTKKITFKSFLFFIIIGLSITSLQQNSAAKKEDKNLKLFDIRELKDYILTYDNQD